MQQTSLGPLSGSRLRGCSEQLGCMGHICDTHSPQQLCSQPGLTHQGLPGPEAPHSLSTPALGTSLCLPRVALQLLGQFWGFLPVPSPAALTGLRWPWGEHQAGTSDLQWQEKAPSPRDTFCAVSCFLVLCFQAVCEITPPVSCTPSSPHLCFCFVWGLPEDLA